MTKVEQPGFSMGDCQNANNKVDGRKKSKLSVPRGMERYRQVLAPVTSWIGKFSFPCPSNAVVNQIGTSSIFSAGQVVLKEATSRLAHHDTSGLNFFKFVVCSPC